MAGRIRKDQLASNKFLIKNRNNEVRYESCEEVFRLNCLRCQKVLFIS